MTRMRDLSAAATIVTVALLVGAAAAPLHADSAASRNNEGNRLYNQGRYDEALKMYVDAQADRPQAPELHYNIGNVLFRKGQFDKAAEEYQRAQSVGGQDLYPAASYNRGNALMKQGDLQGAINSYIQTLRASPSDEDAKRNLELALRMLQEQQQKQQQQQKEGEDPPPDQERGQQNAPPSRGKEDKDEPPPTRQPGEMSPEEARQILEALREEEKEGIRKHARTTVPEGRVPEKDW